MKKVVIIGAGPAGLFCAYQLLKSGIDVDLYDQMSGVGKKFLIAGKSGLNLTHSENIDYFSQKYGKDANFFQKLLKDFNANNVREFAENLGVETFIGTSGRVFPKEMKAAKMLANWMIALKKYENFNLHLKHRFKNIEINKTVILDSPNGEISKKYDFLILALGGGSWKKTGSDGLWMETLKDLGLEIRPLLPMNCGFEIAWSEEFINLVERSPIKNVVVKANGITSRAELMITPYGIEGTAIYSLSDQIRENFYKGNKSFYLDLKPDLSEEEIVQKLSSKRNKDTLSNHLRKKIKLDKTSLKLLRECISKEDFNDLLKLSKMIKNLEIKVSGIRPIDEAISTSGGVVFNELNENLEFKKYPNIYAIGEMLDFSAPTGGYLLQGCFSTAYRAARSIIEQAFPEDNHHM